jgi:hypothetical protein
MLGLLAGIGLAVVASVTINSGFLLQHAGVAADGPPFSPRRPLASVRPLVSSSAWTVGFGLGLLGWAIHVAALSLAPLSLVQAFYAGGLAAAAPIAVLAFGQRLAPAEWRAVVLMAAALALLGIGLHAPAGRREFAPALLGAFEAIALGGALALVARPRRRTPAALGVAAGTCYGAGDTAIKAIAVLARDHGAAAVLASPWPAAAVIASVMGFFCFQRGLQAGGAMAVIALTTASSILSSVLAGLVVFGDPLGRGAPFEALHLAAFVAVGVAAWRLAPFQARATLIKQG